MRIKFKEWNCKLVFDTYQNYRVCLRLVEEETGEPIATATVNLPDEKQEKNEVFIKDYSENTEMLQALINAKVVTAPHISTFKNHFQ